MKSKNKLRHTKTIVDNRRKHDYNIWQGKLRQTKTNHDKLRQTQANHGQLRQSKTHADKRAHKDKRRQASTHDDKLVYLKTN